MTSGQNITKKDSFEVLQLSILNSRNCQRWRLRRTEATQRLMSQRSIFERVIQ